MKTLRSIATFVAAVASLCGMLTWASRAPACIGDEFNSVHFHSGQVDFGRIPRRARVWEADDRHVDDHMSGGERCGVELEEKADREAEREANRVRLLSRADKAMLCGDWRSALDHFRAALARFGPRGVVRDRVEILEGVLRSHVRPAALLPLLRQYTSAVLVSGAQAANPGRAGGTLSGIESNPRAGLLREHALYQWACLAYRLGKGKHALDLYHRQLAAYPHSTKSEAGLIMLARCALLSADASGLDLQAGSDAVELLLRRFPHSRFRRAALGLRARVHFVKGRYPEALSCYFALGDMYSVEIVRKKMGDHAPADTLARLMAGHLRNLARADSFDTYSHSLADLERTRKSFGPADARRFSDILQQDLSLPAPYFYYRLYHTETTPREIVRLGLLARRIVHLHPRATLPPLVLVRFGEVDYFRKKYALARDWADRALAADRGRSEATPRALYVRGASLEKLRRYQTAIGDFEKLVRVYPSSALQRGAREELAILYEASGDLSRALDQYFELGYAADVAFFLDGRMTTSEVEQYLRSRPDRIYRDIAYSRWSEGESTDPHTLHTHELLRYTLGVRYMRMEEWDRAAQMLRMIPRSCYVQFSRGRIKWESKPSPDPLSAIRQLSRLKAAISRAPGAAGRAEAMYRYASYYYSHGTLLLYVPPLWDNAREVHFQFYWNKKHATPKDELFARHYMREHEVYAHALDIYEEIARRYPRSPYAPKALYRAACSAYHQSNLNEWWRDHDDEFGLQRRASKLMAALAQRYPKHALAKEATKYAKVFAGTWPSLE